MTPLRGWLLHEPLIHLGNLAANDGSATGSDYTQQGSRPGLPVASDALGTYKPHAHHAQGEDLEVIALKPGIPGDAGLGYRVDGQADVRYRGWNEPNLVLGYHPLEWTTSRVWHRADAVTCPRSQKVVVAATANVVFGAEPFSVWVWDPSTATWSSRIIPDAASSANYCAITVLRGTGRLLLFATDTTTGAAAVYYSDDDGTTWADYAPRAMRAGTIDGAVDQVRWVEDKFGQLLLVALVGTTGNYWQYASVDQGVSFAEVEFGTLTLRSLSLATLPGTFDPAAPILLVYRDAAVDAAHSRVITDAFAPISDADAVAIDGTNAVDFVQVAVDADGAAYAVISVDGSDRVKVAYSGDPATGWSVYSERLLQLGGTVASAADHAHDIRALAFSGGELIAVFTPAHVGGPANGSLVSLRCGGWSTIESDDGDGRRIDRHSFADPADVDGSGIFLPTEILDDQGWAHTGTAATLADGYHRYNPTAATSYDTLTTSGHSAGDFTVLFEARVVSGGSVADGSCSFLMERHDGSDARRVVIRMSTTQFAVLDASGGGTVLETVDLDMTQSVQFALVWGSESALTVLYRRPSSSVWLEAAQASMGTDPTGVTEDVYEVGCRASTTSDLRVGFIAFMNHAPRRGLTPSGSVGALKWGKDVGTIPYPVRDQVDEEGRVLHLSASGGVARYRETWDLPAVWDYGVANVFPVQVPKPSAVWRTADTGEQVLTWDLGDNCQLGHSGACGLCLIRPNFRRAILEASTSSDPTNFVELGEFNSRVVVSSTFTRSGRLIRPGSNATPGLSYHGVDELRRGFVTLDPSGTPLSRRCARNEGGVWDSAGKQMSIELEGIDGTEPSSGNLHVNACGGVLVVLQPRLQHYRRVRLRIPAQECPDDYFELGGILLGSVWALGQQHSMGWSIRWVPLVRTEEDSVGTIYVEPRGSDEDEPTRREITLSWQSGQSDAALRNLRPRPLTAGTGVPLVAKHDVRRQLVGFVKASKGGAVPSVALLSIPPVTSTLFDPSLYSVGRLGVGQAIQFNHVQGEEGRNEIMRGESLTHVELVG